MSKKYSMGEFETVVVAGLGARGLADGIEVKIAEVVKQNDCKWVGVEARRTGAHFGLVVYIEPWLKKFNEGQSLDSILGEIYDHILERIDEKVVNTEVIADYRLIYRYIYFTVVPYDKNVKFLSDKPYVRKLDLAVIFRIYLDHDGDGLQSVTVTDKIKEQWDVSLEDLWSVAFANTLRLMPTSFRRMGDVLGDLIDDSVDLADMLGAPQMYVLSNTYGIYGAALMLYPSVLLDAAKIMKTNQLLILPSSVHEVIILAWDGGKYKDLDDICNMIGEINSTALMEEDILGYRPYLFTVEDKKLALV
ncbi:MAG: hypothetical protein IKT62_02000 [Firmicutes bacterium]|nr:hypothetical protein [Bacillota bacterium]